MHPFVAVMHRYVVEFLAGHDPSVCAQIMEPDYVLHMGDVSLGPRDDVYVPAVAAQLKQFPGLCMSVNALMLNDEDRLALHFTQHGASVEHHGRAAAWQGIGLYRWNGTRLTSNVALEDYEGRRTQLSAATAAPVPPVATAPWDERPQPPSPAAEDALRAWVESGAWRASTDGGGEVLADPNVTLTDVFSAGSRVAFAGVARGTYAGGLDVPTECVGSAAELHLVGLVTVDTTLSAAVITGRGPLRRALLRTLPRNAG